MDSGGGGGGDFGGGGDGGLSCAIVHGDGDGGGGGGPVEGSPAAWAGPAGAERGQEPADWGGAEGGLSPRFGRCRSDEAGSAPRRAAWY